MNIEDLVQAGNSIRLRLFVDADNNEVLKVTESPDCPDLLDISMRRSEAARIIMTLVCDITGSTRDQVALTNRLAYDKSVITVASGAMVHEYRMRQREIFRDAEFAVMRYFGGTTR